MIKSCAGWSLLARAVLASAVMLSGGWLAGCGESPPTTPGAGGGTGDTTGTGTGTGTNAGGGDGLGGAAGDVVPADAPNLVVIQLAEEHADTFRASLGNIESEPPDPPFTIENGVLRWDPAVATEVDAIKLAARRLTLGSAGVPLAKCAVVVVYSTSYSGKGRNADGERYIAIEKLPATVPLSAGFGGDKLDYDMETSDVALPFLAMGVRLMPKDGQVTISTAADGTISAALGATTKTLAAGSAAELWKDSRAVTVTELAVKSTPVGGGAEIEMTPRVEHGAVTFTTRLTARLLGTFPGAASAAPRAEDMP